MYSRVFFGGFFPFMLCHALFVVVRSSIIYIYIYGVTFGVRHVALLFGALFLVPLLVFGTYFLRLKVNAMCVYIIAVRVHVALYVSMCVFCPLCVLVKNARFCHTPESTPNCAVHCVAVHESI